MAKKRSEGSSTNIIQLKKLLADLEKSILATKKQIVAEDKKSAEYLEKMAKLDAIRSKNRNEYYRIRRQIDQIEKDSLKRAEKESKLKDDLAKKIQEENKQLDKIAKKEQEKQKRAQDRQKLREKELQFEREIGGLQEKSAVLMRSVNQDVAKKAEALKISGQSVAQIADKTQQIKKLFKGTKEETQAFEKTLEHTKTNASKIDDLSAKVLNNMENMKKKGYELIDTYEIEKDLKEQSARLDLNANKMGAERYMLQKKMLDAQTREFQKLKQVNQQMAEKSKQAKETRASMIGWLAAVPGGAFLLNKMGLGKILDGTKTVKQTIKDWGTALKGFAMALPFMALGGIFSLLVTVTKKVIGVVLELDQDLSDLSKQFSVSRNRAEGLFSSLGKMALRMKIVGVNTKELAKTLEDLTEEYGTNLDRLESASMKNGMLQNISLLREKWQLTNEEALNFYKVSNTMGVGMDKLAQASMLVNKNILNSRQSFKAIANIPQQLALGFKGSIKELAAFAGKAKVMGIDLKTFHDALAASLDVESSLEKQMTAEVLSGVHLGEFDAYRYAAELGEDDKAFKIQMEMYNKYIRAYGSNLKGMTRTTRQTVAEQFGISTEEFVAQIARFGQLQDQFGKNSLKAIEKMQQENKKQVGKGGAAGFLLGETQAKEGASITEKFSDDMEKMKIELKDTLMPVVNKLHSMYDELMPKVKKIIEDMSKSLPGIIDSVIQLLEVAKNIANIILGLLSPIGSLMEMLGVITTETKVDEKGNVSQVKKLNAEWFSMSNILLTIGGYFGAKGLLTWGLKKTGEALGDMLKNGWSGLKNWVTGANKATEAVEDVKDSISGDNTKKTGKKNLSRKERRALRRQAMPSGEKIDLDAAIKSAEAKEIAGQTKKPGMFSRMKTKLTPKPGGGMMKSLGKKLLNPKNLLKNAKGGVTGLLGGLLLDATLGVAKDQAEQAGNYKTAAGLDVGSQAANMAIMGGTIGSFIAPGIGTAIGAGLGGLVGAGMGLYQNRDTLFGGDKQQQAAQKPQQAMAQQAASMSRQSAEELKKVNEQMQLLGGDRTWQASKAVNQVAKSTTALSDAFSHFYKSGAHLTFSYVVKTFDSVNNSKIYSFASGITSVSNSIGDLSKKLSKLDVGKLERVSQITNPGVMSTITGAAGSLFGSVKSFFGFGGSSAQQTSTVPASTSTVGGNKNAGSTATATSSGVSVNVNTVALEQKIDKLIAIIAQMGSQPTYIKIGERTVEAISSEIDFRKNKEVGLQRYGGI